jgi:hypothetical protein
MSEISSIDHPIKKIKDKDGTSYDILETESYAKALAKFAMECGTPLTIGVQGEWGSGKTSLLNMMQEVIEGTEFKTQGRGASIKGSDAFKVIWINTWEHSLLKTPEECLLSIIEEIINAIAAVDGSWKTAQKAKTALAMLAKGALRIGASVALGQEAANEVGQSLNGMNSVRTLRTALEQSVDELVKRDQNSVQRFIIFIDDLDRLDPAVAVMILELLKNIFHIENCVFVLAIDYQVVVKGLKSKFGEPNEHNEWEFRAFFDKIIQLPFMMPMGAYNLTNYVENLLQETSYFTKKEMAVLKSSKLSKIVKLTIGANPRALKRLVNSLSLILIQRQFTNKEIAKDLMDNELVIKQLLITLVCLQISFPKLYNLIVKYPIFYEWDDEFVHRVTDTTISQSQETQTALQRAMELDEEDFDETWEQSLFKILWSNGWHKNRIIEISKALSIIKDKVLTLVMSDELKDKLLIEALRLTAVTSVVSIDDSVKIEDQDDDNQISLIAFWKDFSRHMLNSNNCFAGIKKRSTYWSSYYDAVPEGLVDENLYITAFYNSKQMLRITTRKRMEPNEEFRFFNWLKRYTKEFEEIVGIKPTFKIEENRSTQVITFPRPNDWYGDLSIPDNIEKRKKVFDWLKNNVGKIEIIIGRAYEEYNASLVIEENNQFDTQDISG